MIDKQIAVGRGRGAGVDKIFNRTGWPEKSGYNLIKQVGTIFIGNFLVLEYPVLGSTWPEARTGLEVDLDILITLITILLRPVSAPTTGLHRLDQTWENSQGSGSISHVSDNSSSHLPWSPCALNPVSGFIQVA